MSSGLICVPTFENIHPATYKSIYDIKKGDNEVGFEYIQGYDCATARNRIAQLGLNREVDYVLMVDNDVVLPRDALLNLLSNNTDVVLGYYAHRDTNNLYSGRTCICKLKDDKGNYWFNYPLESEYTGYEMAQLRDKGEYKIQIHGGGMGCALIKTNVFRRLMYPWYDWVNYADKNRGMLSEDLFFCEKCRMEGIPLFTDTRVECGHIFRHVQMCD